MRRSAAMCSASSGRWVLARMPLCPPRGSSCRGLHFRQQRAVLRLPLCCLHELRLRHLVANRLRVQACELGCCSEVDRWRTSIRRAWLHNRCLESPISLEVVNLTMPLLGEEHQLEHLHRGTSRFPECKLSLHVSMGCGCACVRICV